MLSFETIGGPWQIVKSVSGEDEEARIAGRFGAFANADARDVIYSLAMA